MKTGHLSELLTNNVFSVGNSTRVKTLFKTPVGMIIDDLPNSYKSKLKVIRKNKKSVTAIPVGRMITGEYDSLPKINIPFEKVGYPEFQNHLITILS